MAKEASFYTSVRELKQNVTRSLILFTSGIYLLWHILATISLPIQIGQYVYAGSIIFAILLTGVFHLLKKHLLIAQFLWLLNITLAITLTLFLFKEPNVAILFLSIPVLAILTVGPAGGLISGLLLGFLLPEIVHFSTGIYLTSKYILVLDIAGILLILTAWTAYYQFMNEIQWSLARSSDAEQAIAQVKDQRLEYDQIREDLVHANRELALISERFRSLQYQAEEARRVKEEFVANVSHELRTPLNMIIGFTELIHHNPEIYGIDFSPSLRADITAILRNSQHLSKLVDDVLDLSQVDVGRMAITKGWVVVPQLVEDAFMTVRPLYEKKDLYLRREIPSNINPIYCDGTRIRQVLINLLSNAGRFTNHGGVQLSIKLENRQVIFSVADTGPGIPVSDQARIFEPFQQQDSTTRRLYGGSGLGLAISKRFIEMHNGKIWLESDVGEGTIVYFSLPIQDHFSENHARSGWQQWLDPTHEIEYRMRTRPFKAPQPDYSPRLILLDKGDLLKRVIHRYMDNVDLINVTSLDDAKNELIRAPAQALVINGSEYFRTNTIKDELNTLPFQTPAILCEFPEEDEFARTHGIVRYLNKPVNKEELISAISSTKNHVKSILIVDNDPEILQLFARMLSSSEKRYTVLRAQNGYRALSLMRERHPDVIILDLLMPELDGLGVIHEMKQDSTICDIPVIVVTSKDKINTSIASSSLYVTRNGGFSIPEVLACIKEISKILSPSYKLVKNS